MYGHQQLYSRPIGNQRSKWYISEEQYPFDMFPTFLSGGAILTHISVVRRLHIAFPYVKIIDLDDVYVAIVAHKLNITLLNNKRFALKIKKELIWTISCRAIDIKGQLIFFKLGKIILEVIV